MGAAESRPSPPSWLVEACATLDPRDVDEVVTLFRRAAKNAEAHGEPGASCPANPKDAAAYVFEQERRLGWHEHDASAREASREAFGTPPALDAVLDRLARSVLAGDATTSGTPGAAPRLSAAGDARETNQPETHGALCAALVARAACRRAACGDGDAVARLGRAVFPKHRVSETADRTRDALEVARALASVALPPDRTTEGARRRDAFLRRVVATSESIASDDSRGPTTREARNERSAFTTLLAQSAYDASMPSRRGRLVPALFDEDGATRLFAGERDGESEKRDDGVEKKNAARRTHAPLISPLAAWFLSRSMPATWRTKWRRVFCSKTHGASFAALVSRCADAGPTLVALETSAGFVVGGVVSESIFSQSPAFFGDARSFVFSLGPTKAPYRDGGDAHGGDADGDGDFGDTSPGDGDDAFDAFGDDDFDFGAFGHARGANENFCYCAYGFSSDRFPNGLGFGGQVGHHCLFLDAGFETGHWRAAAATFGGARLLAPRRSDTRGDARDAENGAGSFEARAVEAWAVDGDFQARLAAKRRAENRRGAGSGARGGVRDARHDEARALMETARRDAGPERQER